MNGNTLQYKVLITNPQGLHMRPITAFAQLARQYQSTVTLTRDARRVDGKSPFEMLTLVSPPGTELLLEVSGTDAHEALRALVEFLDTPEALETPS